MTKYLVLIKIRLVNIRYQQQSEVRSITNYLFLRLKTSQNIWETEN